MSDRMSHCNNAQNTSTRDHKAIGIQTTCPLSFFGLAGLLRGNNLTFCKFHTVSGWKF